MALQKSYEDNAGVTHTSAYWRIVSWDINVGHDYSVFVAIYHDKAARDANKAPICTKNYPGYIIDPESNTMPSVADVVTALHGDVGTGTYFYTQLKTNIPELDGATDVM